MRLEHGPGELPHGPEGLGAQSHGHSGQPGPRPSRAKARPADQPQSGQADDRESDQHACAQKGPDLFRSPAGFAHQVLLDAAIAHREDSPGHGHGGEIFTEIGQWQVPRYRDARDKAHGRLDPARTDRPQDVACHPHRFGIDGFSLAA